MLVKPYIKIYNGYGTPNKFFIIGHVFHHYSEYRASTKNNFWNNIKSLYKLFHVHTLANIPLCLEWNQQQFHTTSEFDGFFRFEVDIDDIDEINYGWKYYSISLDLPEFPNVRYDGKIFLPEKNSFGIVSDIDDTIVKSYSTSTYKKLLELMKRNAGQRRTFERVSEFLNLFNQKPKEIPYTFFYVSSSEWNLYDYIKFIFQKNNIPDGIFLLNSIKTLKDITSTGFTGHEGKFFRIARLFISFPEMKFLLIGDNSQRDVYIYSTIAQKYPEQVLGIFIRNVRKSKQIPTELEFKELEKFNIRCFQFQNSQEIIEKCKEWDLV